MKKSISILLALILTLAVLAFPVQADDAGAGSDTVVYRTAAEAVSFIIVDQDYEIPVRIAPATLYTEGASENVWLIGLLGVKGNKKQVNSTSNLVDAAYNRDNAYSDYVKTLIFEKIPAGDTILFVCHSLGGMVAQHLRADEELTAAYDIRNVLTAGSPLILVDEAKTEGGLVRLCDKWDVIPFLSPATYKCLRKQIKTGCRESGGYFFNPDGAHNLSYLRNDVWGAYDALGVKDGAASVAVDLSQAVAYGQA